MLNSTLSLNNNTKQENKSQSQQLQIATTNAPLIDFKLNVKIEISSGKCVLHSNKSNSNSISNSSRIKTDQMNANLSGSPMPGFYASGLPYSNSYMEQEMRNTNFIFPAIGVKTFYESTQKKSIIISQKKQIFMP